MRREPQIRKLAAIVLMAVLAALPLPVQAGAEDPQAAELAELLAELANPEQERWERVEQRILRIWSQSGSSVADLLLQRGRAALRIGDAAVAIEHLTALVDHAPEFAEGWHARATAFFLANQYGPAMADIERALYLNPHHFGALSGLAVILEDLELDARALDAYRAAYAVHPHRPDIHRAIERLELRLEGKPL